MVSTKVGRLLVQDSSGVRPDPGLFDVVSDLRCSWDFSADGVKRSLEASLRRLETDRVEIALIHDPDERWEEAIS